MPRDDDDGEEPETRGRPERPSGGLRERGGRRRGKLEGRGGPRPESPAPQRPWAPPERDPADGPPVHGRAVVDASDFAPPVRPVKPAPEPREEPGDQDEDEVEDELEADASEPEDEDADEGGSDDDEGDADSGADAAAPGGEHPARPRNPLLGPLIVSRKNARIHLVRSLATRRGRKREGKFLVEGVKVIKELLDRAIPVELILWQDRAEQRKDIAAILAEARTRRIPSYGVVSRLFDELTDTESSQGILAVAPSRWQSLEDALGPVPEDPATAPPRAIVVAAGVQDPGNLGTIIRSARFLGIGSVACLSGTTDPWAPKVVRASAGTILDAPPARVETLAELTELAHARGFKTVALAAHGGRPLEAGPLPRRSVLLLGAEGPGLAASAVTAADEQITIKSSDPAAESLNAAMAFALFAHAWRTAWTPPV
jgi:TrmH family RNA methyltransferase